MIWQLCHRTRSDQPCHDSGMSSHGPIKSVDSCLSSLCSRKPNGPSLWPATSLSTRSWHLICCFLVIPFVKYFNLLVSFSLAEAQIFRPRLRANDQLSRDQHRVAQMTPPRIHATGDHSEDVHPPVVPLLKAAPAAIPPSCPVRRPHSPPPAPLRLAPLLPINDAGQRAGAATQAWRGARGAV